MDILKKVLKSYIARFLCLVGVFVLCSLNMLFADQNEIILNADKKVIDQGETTTIGLMLTESIQAPTTGSLAYDPSVIFVPNDGQDGGLEVTETVRENAKELKVSVRGDAHKGVGEYKIYIIYDQAGTIGTDTNYFFTLRSKPIIDNISPQATYVGGTVNVTVTGQNFFDNGATSGDAETYVSNKIITMDSFTGLQNRMTANGESFGGVDAGGPFVVSVVNQDGGYGKTIDNEGKEKAVFTIYSAPYISEVIIGGAEESLFQGQLNATIIIRGDGFHNDAGVLQGTSSSCDGESGLDILSVTVDDAGQNITLSVNVNDDAQTGARYFKVFNPDGTGGSGSVSSNITAAESITNCITKKLKPENLSIVPTSLDAGDNRSIEITGTGDGNGFSSDVQVIGLSGITARNTIYNSSASITVYLEVDKKAGKYSQDGFLIIDNKRYSTLSSTSIVINRPDPIDFSVVTGSNVYQNKISTVTISGNFGNDSTPKVEGQGISLESYAISASTPFGQSGAENSIMHLYVKVEPDAIAGPRTITVENTDYDEKKSSSVLDVLAVPVPEIINTGVYDLKIGKTEIIKLYVKNLASVYTVEYVGPDLEAVADLRTGEPNPPYDVNGSTLTLFVKVLEVANNGVRGIKITNTDFNTSVTSSTIFNIVHSSYSSFGITNVSLNNIKQGETKILEIETDGAFERTVSAGSNNTKVTIITPVWIDTQTVHLEVTVDPKASTGPASIILTNPSYQVSASTEINILSSDYSVPNIISVTVQGKNDNVIYPGDTVDVIVYGSGFADDAKFETSVTEISIAGQTVVYSTKAVLSITVDSAASAGARTLKVTNEAFGASFVKDEAFNLKETFIINNVSQPILAAGTTAYFNINGSGFKNDGTPFYIYIDDELVLNTEPSGKDKIVFISSRCVSKVQIACEIKVGSNTLSDLHDLSVYFDAIGTTVTKLGIINVPKKPEVHEVQGVLTQGDIGKEITIFGANFENGTSVLHDGTGLTRSTFTVYPPNLIKVAYDVTSDAEKGARILTVLNTTNETAVGSVKVIAPPKVISSFPPTVLKGTTRYLEITGADFAPNLKIDFSGEGQNGTGVNVDPDTTDESKINLRRIETGKTIGIAGSTELYLLVYIGTSVVSGAHDIIVDNYQDEDFLLHEAIGRGEGILKVRTPLRIDNEVGSIRIPQGKESRFIKITGDGFSEETVFSIPVSDVEILQKIPGGEKEVTLEFRVTDDARLGLKRLDVREPSDESAVFKQVIEVIKPVSIVDIEPKNFGIGLVHATMTITGDGIELDTASTTTKRFALYNEEGSEVYGSDITGLDVTDQVQILGGGVDNIIVDTTTLSDTNIRIYFTVLSTASEGLRDIIITNKNEEEENTVTYVGAFNIEEVLTLDVVSPNYKQINSSGIITIRGAGFDPSNDYSTDGSTIVFSGQGVEFLGVSYPSDTQGQNDYTLIIGSFNVTDFPSGITDKARDVIVRNKNGTIGRARSAIVLTETLDITESLISPTIVAMNATNLVINIKGSGIMQGATAYFWAGTEDNMILNEVITNEVEYVSDQEINVYVRTALVDNGSEYNLRVQNPNSLYWDSFEHGSGSVLTVDNRPAINSLAPDKIRIGAAIDVVLKGYNFLFRTLKEDEGTDKAITFGKAGVHIDYDIDNIENDPDGFNSLPARIRIIKEEGVVPGNASLYMYTSEDGIYGFARNILEILPEPEIDEVIPSWSNAEKEFTMIIKGSGFDEGIDILVTKAGTDDSLGVSIEKGETGAIRENNVRAKIESIKIEQAGEYDIKLFNTDGSFVLKEKAIIIYPPQEQAVITSITPAYAVRGENDVEINVEGYSFLPNMKMYFEGTEVTISTKTIYSADPSTATIVVNISEDSLVGPRNLVAENIGAEKGKKLFHIATEPTITEIDPSSIQKGISTIVNIYGENFIDSVGVDEKISVSIPGDGIIVYHGSTTFVSSQHIRTYITVIDDESTSVGLPDVYVSNPFGFRGIGAGLLNIVEPINVTSISPNKVARGDTLKNIIINGSGFGTNMDVDFIGNDIETSNVTATKTQISLDVTVSKDASLTNRGMVVTNLDNDIRVSIDNILAVGPEVIVGLVSPSTIGRGAKGINNEGVDVVITGSNFHPTNNTVIINSPGIVVNNTETNGQTSLKANLTIGDIPGVLGSHNIEVVTGDNSKGIGEGILIIEDKIRVSRIEPQVIVMYKEAFSLYNDSPTLSSAEFSIAGGTLTLKEDGGIKEQYYLYDSLYDIVDELVLVIDGLGGWNASLIDQATALKNEKTVNLYGYGLTDVYGENNKKNIKFRYNEADLTIYGGGFDTVNTPVEVNSSVSYIEITSVTVTGSTQLNSKIKTEVLGASWGERDITVLNPDGTIGEGIGMLNFVDPLEVVSYTPNILGVGATNALVKIEGHGFVNGIQASVKDPANDVTLVSPDGYQGAENFNIEVTVPDTFVQDVTTITLTNINGDSKEFYIGVDNVPVIASITPEYGMQTAGSNDSTMTVVLTGYYFSGIEKSTHVTFSGDGVNVINVSTKTLSGNLQELTLGIRIDRDAGTNKRDMILIDNNNKRGEAVEIFEVLPAPSIEVIASNSLLPGTTGVLEISGTGFTPESEIIIEGLVTEIIEYTYYNSNKFNVELYVSSINFPGTYDVTIENRDKSFTEILGGFTVLQPPKEVYLQSVEPSFLSTGVSNETIIVTGLNFDEKAEISFNNNEITVSTFVYINGLIRAEINVEDSETAVGTHELRITNPSTKRGTIDFKVLRPPKVESLSIDSVEFGQTAIIYVTGDGFVAGSSVTISEPTGITVSDVNIAGSSSLHFTINVGINAIGGDHDVIVTNENGEGIGKKLLDISAALDILNVSPSVFSQGTEGRTVYIQGAGFKDDTIISIEDATINESIIRPTELQLVVDVGDTVPIGDKEVIVRNTNGSKVSKTGVFSVIPPIIISEAVPFEVGLGINEKLITINGTQFKNDSIVSFTNPGIEVLETNFNSENQLTAKIKVTENANSGLGTSDIIVKNSDGNSGKGEDLLEVVETVSVNYISHNYAFIGETTYYSDVTIRGENINLISTPTISFSGAPGLNIESDSVDFTGDGAIKFNLEIDSGIVTTKSIRSVMVRNQDGTIGTGKGLFQLLDPIEINYAIPGNLGKGAQNEKISIYGQGFVSGAEVKFEDGSGGINDKIKIIETMWVDSDKIDIWLNIDNDSGVVGYATITVLNVGINPTTATTNTAIFEITNAPVVFGVEPDRYAQGAKDQTIQITGSGFEVNDTTVTIGSGVQVKSIIVTTTTDPQTIDAIIDIDKGADVDYRNISVLSNSKYGTGRELFRVVGAPSIDTLSPGEIRQGTTKDIEIFGYGFVNGATISIDAVGVTTNSVTYTGAGKLIVNITALEGDSIPGTYNIEVINPDGSIGLGINLLEVKEIPIPPAVLDLSPSRAHEGSGEQTIIFSGSNFQDNISITFDVGGIEFDTATVMSSSQMIAKIIVTEDAIPGKSNVIITNTDGGSITVTDGFEITSTPQVLSVNPSSVDRGGGTKQISVKGAGFLEGAEVDISGYGVDITSVMYNGSADLSVSVVIADTSTIALRDVTVINPYGLTGVGVDLLNIVAPIGVDNISPSELTLNEDREILVNGSGFEEPEDGQDPLEVRFSGVGVTVLGVEYYLNTQLKVTVRILNDQNALGWHNITVTNPDKTETTKNNVLYIGTPVEVLSMDPPFIGRGATNKEVVITGKNFTTSDGSNTVIIDGGGVSVSDVIATGQESISMKVTVFDNAKEGLRNVTVANKNGSEGTAISLLDIQDLVKISEVSPSYIETTEDACVVISSDITNVFSIYLNTGDNDGYKIYVYESSMTLHVEGGTNPGDVTYDLTDINYNTLEKLRAEIGWLGGISGAGQNGWTVNWIGGAQATHATSASTLLKTGIIDDGSEGLILSGNSETMSIEHNFKYGKDIVIRGSGFEIGLSSPIVEIGGQGVTVTATTVDSSIQLTSTIEIDDELVGLGAKGIKVTNSDGTFGQRTGILSFTKPLLITSLSPDSIGNSNGARTESIDITGEGFIQGMSITSESSGLDIADIIHNGDKNLILKIKASSIGDKTIKFRNPTSINFVEKSLTVESLPVVSSVEPAYLPRGAGGNNNSVELNLSGEGFDIWTSSLPLEIIRFSDSKIIVSSLTYLSGDYKNLRIKVRVDRGADASLKDIIITDRFNKTYISKDVFTVTEAPNIASISPDTLTPGTTVTMDIKGNGFTSTSRIDFGVPGITTTTFNFVGEDHIVCDVVAKNQVGIAGVYDVKLYNTDYSEAIAYDILTVLDPPRQPVLMDVHPKELSKGQSEVILTLYGEDFESGAFVTFGGGGVNIEPESITIRSSSEIQLKVSIPDTEGVTNGYRSITVTNGGIRVSNTLLDKFRIKSLPKILSMNPETITRNTTEFVTITGSGFGESIEELRISDSEFISVDSVRVVGDSQITFNASIENEASIGGHDITVITQSGSGDGVGLFKVVVPVEINTIDPVFIAKGKTSKPFSIKGEGFANIINVQIGGGGVSASNLTVRDNEITGVLSCDLEANSGLREIILIDNNDEEYTKEGIFEVKERITIDSVEPSVIGIGVLNKDIVINGTGFELINGVTPTVKIYGGGVEVISTEFASSGQLIANVKVLYDPYPALGDREVEVINADENSGSNTNVLEVDSLVTVGGTNPGYKEINNNTTFWITILGEGFDVTGTTPTVEFSGSGITVLEENSPDSSGQMEVKVEIDSNTISATDRTITLRNEDGTIGIGERVFTITEKLTALRAIPNEIGKGKIDGVVSIYGTGFTKDIQVSINNDITIKNTGNYYQSKDELRLELDLSDSNVKTFDVEITTITLRNLGGENVYFTGLKVTEAPAVNYVTTDTKEYAQGARNQIIQIEGKNFAVNNTTVTFVPTGVRVQSLAVDNSSSIIYVTVNIDENATPKERDIIVESDGNIGTGDGLFTVLAKPEILNVSPSNLIQGTQQIIEITGSGFGTGGNATISFDPVGITTNSVTVINDTYMKATIAVSSTNSQPGTYDITVLNSDGSEGTGENLVNVLSAPLSPAVYSISPNELYQGEGNKDLGGATSLQGKEITINGENFNDDVIVSFGDKVTVVRSTWNSQGSITTWIIVEEDAPDGYRNLTVSNPGAGEYIAEKVFRILKTPTIAEISPNTVTKQLIGAKTVPEIEINGEGFVEDIDIDITGGGVGVGDIIYNGDTQIKFDLVVYSTASVGERTLTIFTPFGSTAKGKINIEKPMSVDSIGEQFPIQVPRGVKGRVITITGSGFKDDAVASIGGGITVVNTHTESSTELSVTVDVLPDAKLNEVRTVKVKNIEDETEVVSSNGIIQVVSELVLSSIEPSFLGVGQQNQTLIIKGSGFMEDATIVIHGGGVEYSTYTTFVGDGELHLEVSKVLDDASHTFRDIKVVNPNEEEKTEANLFEIRQTVEVTEIDPAYMVQGTTEEVRILGSGFKMINGSTPTIVFRGDNSKIIVSTITYLGENSLTAIFEVISDAVVGLRDIKVENADGAFGWKNNIFEVGKELSIASIDPSSLGKGTKNEIITINGDGFTKDSEVTIPNSNIIINDVNYQSRSILYIDIDIDYETTSIGDYDIRVENKNQIPITLTDGFTISTHPVITEVSPLSYSQGAKDQILTITGYNFDDSIERISFGDNGIRVSTFTIVGSNITATISIDESVDPGDKNITLSKVDNSYGIGKEVFSVTPKPEIESSSPVSIDRGSDDITISISGTGFKPNPLISFNDENIVIKENGITYLNDKRVDVRIDVSGVGIGGYDITLTNEDGSTDIGYNLFSIVMPPQIIECVPSQVSQNSPNKEIIINGTNFEPEVSVAITGGMEINIATVNVITPSQIKIEIDIPNDDDVIGARNIIVTNLGSRNNSNSGGSGNGKLEITPIPIITEIDPPALVQNTTSWISIKGKGFYDGIEPNKKTPEVWFSGEGVIVKEVRYTASTNMNVYVEVLEDAEENDRDVFVKNADGTEKKTTNKFKVVAPVKIESVTPENIPQGSVNKSISIKGTGFQEDATIDIVSGAGIRWSDIVVKSNEITFNATVDIDAKIEARDITVTNPDKTEITASDILFVIEPITVTSIDPISVGRGVQNKKIYINGTGFTEGAAVEITGLDVSTISYSNTQIIVEVDVDDDARLESRDVKVINPDTNYGETKELLEVVSLIDVDVLSPSYVTKGTETWITIRGNGFEDPLITGSTPTVYIDGTGVDITTVTVLGSRELKAYFIIASTAEGTKDIYVRNSDGSLGIGDGKLNIVPNLEISRVEPSSLGKGAENQPISIFGQGFVDPEVSFNHAGIEIVPGSIERKSSEQINLRINTTLVGISSVTVTNSNEVEYIKSNAFEVTLEPILTNISPSNEIAQGAKEQTITLTGANFDPNGISVEFSGQTNDIVVTSTVVSLDGTACNVTLNVLDNASLTSRHIYLTNDNGFTGEFDDVLTVIAGPRINSLSPEEVDQGVSNYTMTINGSGFRSGAVVAVQSDGVTVPGISITDISILPESISLKITVAREVPLGIYDIVVTNLDNSQALVTDLLTISPSPSITAVSPSTLERGISSRNINIIGNNFDSGAVVDIDGGVRANETVFDSPTKLIVTVTVPENTPVGPKTIKVTNGNGSIGVAEGLLQVEKEASVLTNITATTYLIDYELMNNEGLSKGTTIQYTLLNPVERLDFSIKNSNNEIVRTITLYDIPLGEHTTNYVLFWDGSIVTNKATGEMGKINGVYNIDVSIFTSDNTVVARALDQGIKVDVMNVYNADVEYTEIGEDKEKIAPYTIKYNLSKSGYVDINVYNEENVLVKAFSKELGKVGENKRIWDSRDNEGKRVPLGIYTAYIVGYDDSNPRDYSETKTVKISVNQLKIVDVNATSIKTSDENSKLSFITSETMLLNINIYKPGTSFNDAGEPQEEGKLVKTVSTFLNRGTTFYFEWDGRNENGDILVDGDYIFVITGADSYGNELGEPTVGSITIARAGSLEERQKMFKENSYPYPNPVYPNKTSSLKVKYAINKASDLKLQIFDLMGNLVYEHTEPNVRTGEGALEWNFCNQYGSKVARGVYVYVVEAYELGTNNRLRAINKVMVIK